MNLAYIMKSLPESCEIEHYAQKKIFFTVLATNFKWNLKHHQYLLVRRFQGLIVYSNLQLVPANKILKMWWKNIIDRANCIDMRKNIKKPKILHRYEKKYKKPKILRILRCKIFVKMEIIRILSVHFANSISKLNWTEVRVFWICCELSNIFSKHD